MESDLRSVLSWAYGRLRNSSGSPHIDAEILLSHVISKNRAWIYSNFDFKLDLQTVKTYIEMINARVDGRPVAYLTGEKNFMGFDFKISDQVLVPRPETEELVELVIKDSKRSGWKKFLDFGCGSGVIAISIAKLLPDSEIWIMDKDEETLKLSQENSLKLGVSKRIHIDEEEKNFDIVISNPPYLTPEEWEKAKEVHKEPYNALVGGKDGNEIYEEILKKFDPQRFYFEIAHPFRKSLRRLFEENGMKYDIFKDISGKDRIAVVWRLKV